MSIITDELAFALSRATIAAALAAAKLTGRGDERAADHAAVEAMRDALAALPIKGRIVVGEGDEAEALFVGEEIGAGKGPALDVALDPLEGTTLTAKAQPGALSVAAFAPRGGLLQAPAIYMEKLAIGPGFAAGVVDLDASADDNVRALAKAKGVTPAEIGVCVLDRPRHGGIIEALRTVGARVHLIGDGDIAGAINCAKPETGIDMYLGSGGAPEGVLAAAALRCVGGQFQARFMIRNDEDRARAEKAGIEDAKRRYALNDLVSQPAIFVATGVTTGSIVEGVRFAEGQAETHTLAMNAATGSICDLRLRTRA
ncbi:MAG: class II fructose-bisphosphatase [Terricaulis sp.]|nr:class II fructose-bisphosphatase [Terricaulis sp.]